MATHQSAAEPRGISGLWHKLTRSQAEVEADELKERYQSSEGAPDTVTVHGMVKSMTIRPRSTVPALEIDLYDGSASVSVVWLGRRRIPGIDPGRSMVVTGRLTGTSANPTIYNPKYELKPTSG
jgi:RecG-like helicase